MNPPGVAGWIRLGIEFLILGGGAAAFFIAGQRNIATATRSSSSSTTPRHGAGSDGCSTHE
jgi:hypothetical protein